MPLMSRPAAWILTGRGAGKFGAMAVGPIV